MNNITGKLISVEEYEKLTAEERRGYTLALDATATQIENMKVGRNEICPCGSGKKFKKCHQVLS